MAAKRMERPTNLTTKKTPGCLPRRTPCASIHGEILTLSNGLILAARANSSTCEPEESRIHEYATGRPQNLQAVHRREFRSQRKRPVDACPIFFGATPGQCLPGVAEGFSRCRSC